MNSAYSQLHLAIADRIAGSSADGSGIVVWHLGQSGFLLQHRGTTIAIDPYLSRSVDLLPDFPAGFWQRAYPPVVPPEQLDGIDLVLCSHDHLDHTDPDTLQAIAAASPECRFAGPRASMETVRALGVASERIVVLRDGQNFDFRDIAIEPIAVAHEEYERDAEGFDLYLGFLLTWNGIKIFHAGDTVATPRLTRCLASLRVDVGFLPINGRDEARRSHNIVGNMTAAEAIQFAVDIGLNMVIPTHYELYANNGAPLSEFITAWERLPILRRPKFKAFCPGERCVLSRQDRARDLAVIVGAGKTGRGFLARLLNTSAYDIVFVDASKELVGRLNEDRSYVIHFFGEARSPWHVSGIRAALAGSDQAICWMSRAEVIFVAVGESKVAGIADDLEQALNLRDKCSNKPLQVFVCENGASPGAPLRERLGSRRPEIEIAEAAIFCSTIELPGTRLDIQSENYDQLPYDAARARGFECLPWMTPVAEFPTLLRRKIYTYNCFSACIAYLGAYKGYLWYADAARDHEIETIIQCIAEPLNRAIAQTYAVTLQEQEDFSQAAMRKFKDENIRDDIARNARNVVRKLAPNDRLIEPFHLIFKHGGDTDGLALTMAAALLYRGPEEAELQFALTQRPVEEIFQEITGCDRSSALAASVSGYYKVLQHEKGRKTSLLDIFARKVVLLR